MDDSIFDVDDGSDFAPEPVRQPQSVQSLSLTYVLEGSQAQGSEEGSHCEARCKKGRRT